MFRIKVLFLRAFRTPSKARVAKMIRQDIKNSINSVKFTQGLYGYTRYY